MEDAGTSEEEDDIDSQDSNTPIDHGHLARNCSIKITVGFFRVVPVGVFATEARRANTSTRTTPEDVCHSRGTKRRGEGILRMQDAGTSEEEDDIDSQDSNTPIDHGHVARNCTIKIITPALKASVISQNLLNLHQRKTSI